MAVRLRNAAVCADFDTSSMPPWPVGQYATYGKPDQRCVIPARPIGGYQAATEELWVRGTDVISAIFRDATLEAFGHSRPSMAAFTELHSGPCGLTGRFLVGISPAFGSSGPEPCSLALHPS